MRKVQSVFIDKQLCLMRVFCNPLKILQFAGSVDPLYLLEQTELQIANAKEAAFSRKEILDKVEKWFAAREEECWLEEYSRVEHIFDVFTSMNLFSLTLVSNY